VEPRNRSPAARKSPLGGSEIWSKWLPKGALEASGRALDGLWEAFGRQGRLGLKSSTALDDTFSPPGAARGPFWTQFELILGVILGSIWGSRARAAILVKSSPAPRREHDFHGSGGSKKEPKSAPKRVRKQPALQGGPGGLLGASGPRCWTHFGPQNRPPERLETALDSGTDFDPQPFPKQQTMKR